MHTITLSKAKAAGACESAYKAALTAVKDKEKPLTIESLEAIEGLTLKDLYWAVRLTDASPLEVRRLKADNAALVLDIFEKAYPNDPFCRKAIEVARDANGTEEEIAAAAAAVARTPRTFYAAYAAYAAVREYAAYAAFAAAGEAYAYRDSDIAPEQRRLLRGFFHGEYKVKGTLLC